MTLPLDTCLYVSTAIFCIGVYGVLSRQNVIVILMSLELMLNGVNLALLAFGRLFISEGFAHAGAGVDAASPSTSHAFVVIVLAVAAAEAAVGLAILLAVYRRWRSVNSGEIHLLSG